MHFYFSACIVNKISPHHYLIKAMPLDFDKENIRRLLLGEKLFKMLIFNFFSNFSVFYTYTHVF